MNIFNEANPYNISLSNDIDHTNLFYGLEGKEVIYNSPLLFDYDNILDFQQFQNMADNANNSVGNSNETQHKMTVVSSLLVITSHFKPNLQYGTLHRKMVVMVGSHFVSSLF